ncbi:MAG: undecaprenyl-diphosphate phosphatase [Patescibacteria group bacterium]
MNFIDAIILSIVEGLTEFLPISSTGHLVLTARLLNIAQTDFVKSFEIFIQLGAILAVLVLYGKNLFTHHKVFVKIAVAFIPTALIGLALHGFVNQFLLGNAIVTLLAMGLGGVVLIALEKWHTEKEHHTSEIAQVSFKNAVAIGFFQSIAMIPGVSRSAASILGGMFMGLKRKTATEFSFLLAIPTMFAATTLDLIKSPLQFDAQQYGLLTVGFIGAFIAALLAVKFFVRFIEHHNFIPFGIYRILLALIMLGSFWWDSFSFMIG